MEYIIIDSQSRSYLSTKFWRSVSYLKLLSTKRLESHIVLNELLSLRDFEYHHHLLSEIVCTGMMHGSLEVDLAQLYKTLS